MQEGINLTEIVPKWAAETGGDQGRMAGELGRLLSALGEIPSGAAWVCNSLGSVREGCTVSLNDLVGYFLRGNLIFGAAWTPASSVVLDARWLGQVLRDARVPAPSFIPIPPPASPDERRQRLQRLVDDEKAKNPRGAISRVAALEGITRQTLSGILKRNK